MAFELPGLMPKGVNPQKAFAVLTAITNRASQQRGKWIAWPSWDTIRQDIGGMGKNQFGATLRALQNAGLLRRFYRGRVPVFEITLQDVAEAGQGSIASKREPTFPLKGKPKEQALSEQTNHQPSIEKKVDRETEVPEMVVVEKVKEQKAFKASKPGDDRILRQLPALMAAGLLTAIWALCRRTGADKINILAAVEHGLTDTVRPPSDPMKAAIWRADHVNDSRMQSLRHKARIALDIPVERHKNKALEQIMAARSEAVPLADGLQAMRAKSMFLNAG